ncbi:type VI secretion system Vgr family protein [Variovorax sp. 2RAF20]
MAGRKDDRGQGFELRTDGHGAVRAANGGVQRAEHAIRARRHRAADAWADGKQCAGAWLGRL